MRGFLSVLFLGAALLAPAGMRADDDHHGKDHRYYDRDAKDYHEWNEHENRAYRRYLEENHRRYHEWAKAKREEQREYWRWRHNHPDSELFRDHDRR